MSRYIDRLSQWPLALVLVPIMRSPLTLGERPRRFINPVATDVPLRCMPSTMTPAGAGPGQVWSPGEWLKAPLPPWRPWLRAETGLPPDTEPHAPW